MRFLVSVLAAFALLVLAAAWQLNTDKRDIKPRKPLSAETLPEPTGAEPLAADIGPAPLEAPTTKPLLPAPPAPEVDNDPNKGQIWVRLLDSRTNQPLANTNCELWRLPLNKELWERENYEHRNTRLDGLISLSVGVVEGGDDEVYREHRWDVCVWTGMIQWMAIPVPRGWFPQADIEDFANELEALFEKPGVAPVDLVVTPNANVRIVARDQWGAPLPIAELDYYVSTCGRPGELWFKMGGGELGYVHDDERREIGDELRRVRRRDGVTCTLERPEDIAARKPLSDEQPTRGSAYVKDIPCLRIACWGYDPIYGYGEGVLDLQPGSNELNVYFKPAASGTVKFRIEWLEEATPPLEVRPRLRLTNTGPFGDSEIVSDSPEALELEWNLAPSESGLWVGELRNVPPGYWNLLAAFGTGFDGSERFHLAHYETPSIRLFAGAGAYWQPVIRCGGKTLENASVLVLGGYFEQPYDYDIYCDPATGEPDTLELPSGRYTVWIPTLPPVSFTLAPGETRRDLFDIRVASVSFSISVDLAELLGGTEEGVRLDIEPVGLWYDARGHLYSLDKQMRGVNEDYDLLMPGIARNWTIPYGDYEWTLTSTDKDLHGRIQFAPGGDSHTRFGLDSLPGYGALVVDLVGFDPENPPRLDLLDLESFRVLPAEGVLSSGPVISFRGPFEDVFDVDVETLWLAPDKAILFAPPGSMILDVWGSVVSREFVVSFPGQITIRAEQFASDHFTSVSFTRSSGDEAEPGKAEAGSYRVELWSGTGWFVEGSSTDDFQAPQGKLSVFVERSESFANSTILMSGAWVEVDVGREPLEIDISKLDYQPFAVLDLTFKGRGSPEQPTDAWWTFGEPASPRLLSLDDPHPRLVNLIGPTEYLPEGRLEFSVRGMHLPSGRYRVIPWPDAPAKYCRDFTLKPGERSSIVVQGG